MGDSVGAIDGASVGAKHPEHVRVHLRTTLGSLHPPPWNAVQHVAAGSVSAYAGSVRTLLQPGNVGALVVGELVALRVKQPYGNPATINMHQRI